MKKPVVLASALLMSAFAVPVMSLAQVGVATSGAGSIGADDAQHASKVLTKLFGHYDGARRCWPVAAEGAAPASCLSLVQAIGVDATNGTQLHLLLGGAGVTEMVTLARSDAPDGWAVLAHSAPLANGTGDAPAEARDLKFQKLGQNSWGWTGRGAVDKKYVVYAARGEEIVGSGSIPAGGALTADASDPTRPHYPLAASAASTAPAPTNTTIAGVGESWRYDEVAKNYVPVPYSREPQQYAAAKPAPHAASPRAEQRFASTELPDRGVVTASTETPPVITPGLSKPGLAPPPVVVADASPVEPRAEQRAEAPVAAAPEHHVAEHHVAEHREAARHEREPVRVASAARRHVVHPVHVAARTVTITHHRARVRLAQLHTPTPAHHALVRHGSRSTGRANVASLAPRDVTDLMQPTEATIAEMTDPAAAQNSPVQTASVEPGWTFGIVGIRAQDWSDFADDRVARAIWSWSADATV